MFDLGRIIIVESSTRHFPNPSAHAASPCPSHCNQCCWMLGAAAAACRQLPLCSQLLRNIILKKQLYRHQPAAKHVHMFNNSTQRALSLLEPVLAEGSRAWVCGNSGYPLHTCSTSGSGSPHRHATSTSALPMRESDRRSRIDGPIGFESLLTPI